MSTPSTSQPAQGAADPAIRTLAGTVVADLSHGIYHTDEFVTPAAASANAIKTSVATSTSTQTYSGVALNGSIGAGALSPARPITATTGSDAGAYTTGSPIVVTGTDVNSNVLVDNITLTQTGGGETVSTAKAFASVTSIAVPVMGSTGGSFTFGFGAGMGLRAPAKARAGLGVNAIAEVANGARVTTGSYTSAASAPPNGTYAPSHAADGSYSYAVTYELS